MLAALAELSPLTVVPVARVLVHLRLVLVAMSPLPVVTPVQTVAVAATLVVMSPSMPVLVLVQVPREPSRSVARLPRRSPGATPALA